MMRKKLYTNLFESEMESLVRLGSYDNRDEAIRDAIRNLIISRGGPKTKYSHRPFHERAGFPWTGV